MTAWCQYTVQRLETLLGPVTNAEYVVSDEGSVADERSDSRSFVGSPADAHAEAVEWLRSEGVPL